MRSTPARRRPPSNNGCASAAAADQVSAGAREQVVELEARPAEEPRQADAREEVRAGDADVGRRGVEVRFRRADVGTQLEHAGGQAGGQLRRRIPGSSPSGRNRPSTISRGDAPEQHRERVRATRGLELELLLGRAGRGHLRLHALERELVALAAFLADALDAQRFLAVGERLACVRKLLRRGLQRIPAAGDLAAQAQAHRLAIELRGQQSRPRRLRGVRVTAPEVELVAHGALQVVGGLGRPRCPRRAA